MKDHAKTQHTTTKRSTSRRPDPASPIAKPPRASRDIHLLPNGTDMHPTCGHDDMSSVQRLINIDRFLPGRPLVCDSQSRPALSILSSANSTPLAVHSLPTLQTDRALTLSYNSIWPMATHSRSMFPTSHGALLDLLTLLQISEPLRLRQNKSQQHHLRVRSLFNELYLQWGHSKFHTSLQPFAKRFHAALRRFLCMSQSSRE